MKFGKKADVAAKPWEAPDAAEIKKRWGECIEDMLDLRRNYLLNQSYFQGDQWLKWSDSQGQVELLEFEATSDQEDRVTVNKIRPRTLHLLSRAIKTPLDFEPRPEGADQEALRRMNLQRQVLQVTAHRDGWEDVRADEVLNTLLGAVSAVSLEPTWDEDEFELRTIDGGEEVTLPTRPKVILTPLTPIEFGIEPGSRSARKARYWIRLTTLTPAQAQERYNLDEAPRPDSTAQATSVAQAQMLNVRSSSRKPNTCLVYVYYERPTPRSPGCVRHVIGDKVVEETGWPFPFTDRLNLVTFAQSRVSSSTWKADTIVSDARQMQRNLNRGWTSINRLIGKVDGQKLLWPQGSVVSVRSDEVTGDTEVWEYDSSLGAEPHWAQSPQVPRWQREHIDHLGAEIDDTFSTHAVSRGEAPGDRNSGAALAILAEKDETPLGPMAKNQQSGWQQIAEDVLVTMRHWMSKVDEKLGEERVISDVLMSDDGETADVVEWTAADLPERAVVHVPLETVMPKSTVAQQDMMIRLAGVFPQLFGGLNAQQLTKLLQVPDPTAFTSVVDPHRARAIRENALMLKGFGDDVVTIQDWDPHPDHIEEHNAMRATPQFEEASPEVQAFVAAHIDAHAALQAELMKAQQLLAAPPMPPDAAPPMPPDAAPPMTPDEGAPPA